MKKLLEELKNDKIIHYIMIFLAATLAGIPLIKFRIYGTDDGFIHILRIMGVDGIIKEGVFPQYIYSKYCNGFGYAINLFYPPLVTYGPLLFKIFTTHYYTCLKIYTFFTILISGITMYKLGYELTKKREIALLSSIIYIFIPYRLECIYNRFAMGEFSGFMFLPLLFLGLHNLLNGNRKEALLYYYFRFTLNVNTYNNNNICSTIFSTLCVTKYKKIKQNNNR